MRLPTRRSLSLAIAVAPVALAIAACDTMATKRYERGIAYARVAQAVGDWEEAARCAEEAEAALPDGETISARALYVLGERARIALAAGRDADAEVLFVELRDRIEADRPGTIDLSYALNEIAKLREQAGDPDAARALFERVVALEEKGRPASDEHRAFAYAGLGRLARDAGDFGNADRLFRLAITQGSTTGEKFAEIRTDYGAMLRGLGRADEAERVEEGIGAPPAAPHYLWYVAGRVHGDPAGEWIVRRWPDQSMPLRVYVPDVPRGEFPGEEPAAVRATVIAGVEAWTDVVRPGVPSFVFVDSSWGADVRFRWSTNLRDMLLGETRAAPTVRFRPGRIRLAPRWSPRLAAPLSGLQRVVEHEMGHALGLWGHSPEATDLMYAHYYVPGRRTAPTISERDKETLRALYALPPGQTVLWTDLR